MKYFKFFAISSRRDMIFFSFINCKCWKRKVGWIDDGVRRGDSTVEAGLACELIHDCGVIHGGQGLLDGELGRRTTYF